MKNQYMKAHEALEDADPQVFFALDAKVAQDVQPFFDQLGKGLISTTEFIAQLVIYATSETRRIHPDTPWRPFEGFCVYARVQNNTLYDMPMYTDGGFRIEDAGEVTAPVLSFLNAFNEAFGTHFELDDFAGR